MLDKSDESLTRVYNALANPTRRQIVQILKERGKAGFKELHDTLKLSVGALYHHLDSLEGFVAQGSDRKYVLTDDGSAAINAFSSGQERIIANAAQAPRGEPHIGLSSGQRLLRRTRFNSRQHSRFYCRSGFESGLSACSQAPSQSQRVLRWSGRL